MVYLKSSYLQGLQISKSQSLSPKTNPTIPAILNPTRVREQNLLKNYWLRGIIIQLFQEVSTQDIQAKIKHLFLQLYGLSQNIQRMDSPLNSSKVRKYHYVFESLLQEVRIKVRFACRISVAWNYGEGQVRTQTCKPLSSGSAKFDEKLNFSASVFFDQEKQVFAEQKSTIQISIITDNGTSIAGFVPIDLGGLLNRKDRKDIFEIERCPDKTATIKMKLAFRVTADRYKNRVRIPNSEVCQDSGPQDEAMVVPPKIFARSVTPHSQYGMRNSHDKKTVRSPEQLPTARNSSSRDFLDKELMVLKGRVTEFQSPYKAERTEKQKMAQTLKLKQELLFSMKTELRRKEIQLGDCQRSLQEYCSQYEKVKSSEDDITREYGRLRRLIEHEDSLHLQKVMKAEVQLAASERKYQKIAAEYEKVRKQKQVIMVQAKVKMEQWCKQRQLLSEQLKGLRKEKEETSRQGKTDKDGLEKAVRELTKKLKDTEEELENQKNTALHSEKRLSKLDELRFEQLSKLRSQLSEVDKLRQCLADQLEGLKYCSASKQQSLQQAIKSFQAKLACEKATVSTLKSQNSELLNQLNVLQTDSSNLKQQLRVLQEKCSFTQQLKTKFQNEANNYRSQINSLSQQINNKNLELKSFESKIRQIDDNYQMKITKMKQIHDQTIMVMERKITQLRYSQQSKANNSVKQLARRDKQLQDAINRQQRMAAILESARQQARRTQIQHRQKIEQFRKTESTLRQSLQSSAKQLESYEYQVSAKLHGYLATIQCLESDALKLSQSLSIASEKEQRMLQEIARLNDEADQGRQVRVLLEEQESRVRECEWRIEELSEEIRIKTAVEVEQANSCREMKQKIVELEALANNRDRLLIDRDRDLENLNKRLRQEKKEKEEFLAKFEAESKSIQEDLKETLRKERVRIDSMQIESERLKNQLSLSQADCLKHSISLQQMQNELKTLRQTNQSIIQDKESLQNQLYLAQSLCSQLQQSQSTLESSLIDKDRQLKKTTQSLNQLQQHIEQQQRAISRNHHLIKQVHDLAAKIDTSPSSNALIENSEAKDDEFDRLTHIKKMLTAAEYRVKRLMEEQEQRDGNAERELAESQRLNRELSKSKAEVCKLRKEFEEMTFTNNSLRIQKEEISSVSQEIQAERVLTKRNLAQIQLRYKAAINQKQTIYQQMKSCHQRYEVLLQETRLSLTQRAQRQKKDMASNIKRLQQKVEQQQEKLFTCELQMQKIPELIKREQESRRLLTKISQTEKHCTQRLQQVTKNHQALEAQLSQTVWEKKQLEETLSSTISRNQKLMKTLQSQLQQSQIKTKSMVQQTRLLQDQTKKQQQTINKLTQQLTSLKTFSKQQQQKLYQSQLKLKNELNRLRVEATQHKRTIQQQAEKLSSMESLRQAKATLEEQLSSRDNLLIVFQQKEEKLSEQMLSLRHQFQEVKEEYQRKLEAKENEIMQLEEELFKVNSNDNVRFLKDSEIVDRVRILENDKKALAKQNAQAKTLISQLKDQFTIYLNENSFLRDIIQQNKTSTQECKDKQDSIERLQEEIGKLNIDNSRLKGRISKFQLLS